MVNSPFISDRNAELCTSDERPTKRSKATHSQLSDARYTSFNICSLPLELIAEILNYVTPRDILALARTNKYFCATLANNTSTNTAFIWKNARKRFLPCPVPDPTPNFTEASYAAFLFDWGKCENCGRTSRLMYASFLLRLRLCHRVSCQSNWRQNFSVTVKPSDHPRYSTVLQWLPRLESTDFSVLFGGMDPGPFGFTYRKSDWEKAVDEFNKLVVHKTPAREYVRRVIFPRNRRLAKMTEHCLQLINWRNECDKYSKAVTTVNLTYARTLATCEGWILWDLLRTPSFESLYRSKNRSWERIVSQDSDLIRNNIERELIEIAENRDRRQRENTYRERREGVAARYQQLNDNGEVVMPNLSEFRKLPIIKRIQQKPPSQSSNSVEEDMDLAEDWINDDLAQWKDMARSALGAVLGFPLWKSASKHKLHPTERLTARFICKRCGDSTGKWSGRGMSFAEACAHKCEDLSKRKKGKQVWRAENFEADSKAINTIAQLVTYCGTDVDDPISLDLIRDVGVRILCLSCSACIVMNYKCMLRHCERHEAMRLQLLPITIVQNILQYPFQYGLRAHLMNGTQEATDLRKERIYGCRHCIQADSTMKTLLTFISQGKNKDNDTSHAPSPFRGGKNIPKLFSFDGLRSHAKEKHGIVWIGDEDFYGEGNGTELFALTEPHSDHTS